MNGRIEFAVLMAIVGLVAFGSNVIASNGGQSDLAVVRQVTARFHDVEVAKAAGYELGYVNGSGTRIITGCIANPTAGVMGYHYFNKRLIDDLVVDPQKPEGLVYTKGVDDNLNLVGGGVRRPRPQLEPARRRRAADRARDQDAHPRPGGRLLHPALLGVGQ